MSMKHGVEVPRGQSGSEGRAAARPPAVERGEPETSSTLGFVHLHVHSSYSLREGAMAVGKLITFASADRQPALAITDTNNLFGALEFSEKVAKAGLQPIIGIQLDVGFGDGSMLASRGGEDGAGRAPLVLLAKDERGYMNLMHLASRAFLDPTPGEAAHVGLHRLEGRTEGLIALTGGPGGPLDRCYGYGRPEVALERLMTLETLFPQRLYVELQRHGLAKEREVEGALIELAYDRGLPLVATNEPFFAALSDYEAHDALICIAEGAVIGQAERRQLSPEHRFKTRAEMMALFADLPEATASTVEIARRCAYRPRTRKPILPAFTTGAAADEAAELVRQADEGLTVRLAARGMAPGLDEQVYRDRLAFELTVITNMKFPGYFLIVADFIKWAKEHGIPVGPGRGSGAGSLVAYALTITDLDPLQFGLLFERFLNPERVSMPDFDIDFCQDRREEVIRYVRERYGADKVAQIVALGSFLARGVVRNVGRVLEMPLGQVDKLAKLIPAIPGKPITLKQAIADEVRLREAAEADPKVERLLAISQTLEGLYSNASTHAAGVVIGDRPLDELVPLYRDPNAEMPATQFNLKWVESAGLVKFDFLGLKTLTTLATAAKLLARRGVAVDFEAIGLEDAVTYTMLARGETLGVFQLESAGMRKALVEMRADRFEDIIALVALYRPGPMANIPHYCAVKLGEAEADYLHPKLEVVLKETHGVIIYQEQVMQIAQILSGYSLGEADMLRRAMGKKIKAEMDAQRERFVSGAVSGGLKEKQASEIFDLLAKFADYGFNKSHAAAYAVITFQTAWLKANHPVEFLAASMTLDKGNTDKLAEFANEARRMGVTIEPPSVLHSGVDFEVCPAADGKLAIRYALSAVKGVGEGQALGIVTARGDRPFKDLADFANRLNPRDANKRVLESLTAAGAFDDLDPDRAKVHAGIETILAVAARRADERSQGQSALFGADTAETLALPKVPGWPFTERLQREYNAVGFFLSGHPLDAYAGVLKRLGIQRWGDFCRQVKAGHEAGRLAATVLDRAERRTRSGSKMGIVQLSDQSGQYEAILFQEGLTQFRDLLVKGANLLLGIQAQLEGEDVRARIVSVQVLEEAAQRVQKGLQIFVRSAEPLPSIGLHLGEKGEGEVSIIAMTADRAECEIKLPGRFKISPQIAGAIKAIPGIVAVEHV